MTPDTRQYAIVAQVGGREMDIVTHSDEAADLFAEELAGLYEAVRQRCPGARLEVRESGVPVGSFTPEHGRVGDWGLVVDFGEN